MIPNSITGFKCKYLWGYHCQAIQVVQQRISQGFWWHRDKKSKQWHKWGSCQHTSTGLRYESRCFIRNEAIHFLQKTVSLQKLSHLLFSSYFQTTWQTQTKANKMKTKGMPRDVDISKLLSTTVSHFIHQIKSGVREDLL